MKKAVFMSLSVLMAASASTAWGAQAITKVAESDYQWTGIAVSKEGRIFVNYPTWSVPSPFKVAEVVDGKEVAYPSAKDNETFVCVQSVVTDDQNRLWVLDPANPDFNGVVEAGPKLYLVDIGKNEIEKTYSFSKDVYTEKSYLNDVRIDTEKQIAYMTDSEVGGIVALDLNTGESWLPLDSSCKAVLANLEYIDFPDTGRFTGTTHSDGIELSADRKTLYFQSLMGDILYGVPTAPLLDKSLSVKDRCDQVKVVNQNNVPTDGILEDNGKLYMADLPGETVWEFDLATGKGGRSTSA